MTPCELGGDCDLVVRVEHYGTAVDKIQCRKCSIVYRITTVEPARCDHCRLLWGRSLHDPCLGTLDGVVAACCGHGNPSRAFTGYTDGRIDGVPF